MRYMILDPRMDLTLQERAGGGGIVDKSNLSM